MNYEIFNRSVVLLICCTFFLVSCSKDDEDENKENIAFSPIELPALRNGADDIFYLQLLHLMVNK